MSATQAIVTDNRSKRQVERDTRRNEATAQKRLTSRGCHDRGGDHRDLLDDPDVRPAGHVVPSGR